MEKNNSALLRQWVTATIIDNPKILTDSDAPVDIYNGLQTIWLKEVQIALKEELKKELKEIFK